METNNNLPSEVDAPFNEAENCNESETFDQAIAQLSKPPILEHYLNRTPESRKLDISPTELDKQVQVKLNDNKDEQADETEEPKYQRQETRHINQLGG